MMANPPLPRDVQDFQFKLVSRLKVYDRSEERLCGPMNLLAVSTKYGLVFVGSPSHLQIFETSVLLESRGSKGGGADTDAFPRYSIPLPSRPTHIGVSCDQIHVAVALAPKDSNQCPIALIYSIASFTSKNPTPVWELRLSPSPGVTVQEIAWNPRLPLLICICLCDGSVSVYELKGTRQTFEIYSLAKNIGAKCISWSPKGKQLVIGTAHGLFIQYKPDLKQVKTISSPQPGNLSPISLLWLSSFQFAVVYGSPLGNASGGSRPGLYIVNSLKGESESYLNYEDICYSSGELRPIQYYLVNIPKWNVLLMSSANSSEVGVLAADCSRGEPLVWEQWTLEDASRAELPLSSSREEMYAAGMAIDTSPTSPLPWGENQSIPPAPLLLLLSHHGLLCSFNIINLRPGAAQDLCSPSEAFPGIHELLVTSGPPNLSLGTPTTGLSTFGVSSGVVSEGFAISSNTFSQNPLSSFTPPSQNLSSLASPTPSFFDSKTQKADTGKGWLSGTQGTSSIMGFGGIGSSIAASKDITPTCSVPAAFSFSASTAVQSYPSDLTTTASPFSSQPQVAPFSAQLPSLPVAPAPAEATQWVPSSDQAFPSFAAAPPTLAPAPLLGDNNAPAVLSRDMVSTGKLKFEPPAPTPENVGDKRETSSYIEGTPQACGVSKPTTDGSKTVAKLQDTSLTSSTAALHPQVTAAASPISDAAIFNAIRQETELFEKELSQLKAQDQDLHIEIGTPEEKRTLRIKVDAVEGFLNEVSETTQGQASEIAALRTLIFEAFAWVEEAKSRQLYSKNPRYLHLAMVQGLDPVIKKHVMAIRNRIQYLDSQLQQIDSNLDNQWEIFQSACNKKNRKKPSWGRSDCEYGSQQFDKKEIHMPSLEYVYQTILSQQQVLEKHKAHLDEVELKVRNRANWELNGNSLASIAGFQSSKKRDSCTNRERSAIGEQDLSSMAESLLAMQLSGSKFDGVISERQCSKNPLLPKRMSSQQTVLICHLLAHRPMLRVIPSPRGMSSSNILQFPFKMMESKSQPKMEAVITQNINTTALHPSAPSGKPLKVMPMPAKKELPASKLLVYPASLPAATSLSVTPNTLPPSLEHGAEVLSSRQLFPSGGLSFEAAVQPVMPSSDSAPGQSAMAHATSESSHATMEGFSSLPVRSAVQGKSPAVATKGIGFSGLGSAVPTHTSIIASSSPSAAKTGPIVPLASSLAQEVATSSPAFSPPISTKNVQPTQSSSIFSGMAPVAVSTSSAEGNSRSFSTSGSFSIGSSSKPGGISSGKPVIPQTASLPFVPTSVTSTPATSDFTLNFTGVNTKPSFSLALKPVVRSTFTLPSTAFGSQSSTVSSSKEPLFVFGGSSTANTSPTESVLEESNLSTKKESSDKDKIPKQAEDNVIEKDTGGSGPIPESKEKPKSENLPSTFSFTSALGQPTVSPTPISVPDSVFVGTTTANAAPTSVMVQNSTCETVTSDNKTESSSEKEVSEEKPAAVRSLFSDFNFRLSGSKSEVFGAKPSASVFSGVGTPSSASVPVSTSIFGMPSAVAPLPQSPVNLAPESLPTSLPIISETEPTTTTTTNPLSSLGNIVANLGSSTFGKSTAEECKQSPTFSAFSFALPAKDDPLKSLSPGTVSAQSGDTQKTSVQGFPSVSSPGVDSPAAALDTAASQVASDFSQGLANILGQSMPSSSSPIQQHTAQNPFAGSSNLFASSTNSNPNTALLFGKPAEGTVAVGLFGQPLKQDGATTPFYGNTSATTPTSTSVPTFGSGALFSQPASPPASVFGGSNFGSKPVFGAGVGTGFSLGGSVFGQSGGSPPPSSSIFGPPTASTSGNNVFQSPATPSASVFGSGASGGSMFGSVAQAGFGSPGSFQAKPGGFGGSPVFGSIAPGNTSPSFGGAATFGSPPPFGSHIFGSSVPSGGTSTLFSSGGSPPPSTFENLATAQTLTFGNLAQGGNTGGSAFGGGSQTQAPSAFGSAGVPSGAAGSSSFGGSSFTSWR